MKKFAFISKSPTCDSVNEGESSTCTVSMVNRYAFRIFGVFPLYIYIELRIQLIFSLIKSQYLPSLFYTEVDSMSGRKFIYSQYTGHESITYDTRHTP